MSDDAAVAWLRAQIEGDKAAASAVFAAAELFPGHPSRMTPLGHQVFDGSGIVVTHDRTVVLPSDVATHIALHDPQDVIADCEAKLCLLQMCGPLTEAEIENQSVPENVADEIWSRLVHKTLALAYKHREGYEEHWGKAQ